MENSKGTIVQVDVSISGIPTAIKIASSGYNVNFATTSDYVASQLKEYKPSLHKVPKSIFTRLLLEGMLTVTTDLERALASSKIVLVTTHALGSEDKVEVVINLFKQIAPYITPNSLLIYGGLSPPGTMDEIVSTLDRYSRLDIRRELNMALITPLDAQTETHIVCSPNFEVSNVVKKFVSTFIPSNAIRLHNTFKEAEVANLLLIARRVVIKALSSYFLLMFKQLDVNLKDALCLSECKAATAIEDDPLSEIVINYLVSEECKLPQRLMLMRNIVKMRKMLLEEITTRLRQEIRSTYRKSKDFKIACIVERESDKDLVSSILPRKDIKVHFYTIDEVESKVNAGVERIIPFDVNLIISVARPQSISEQTIHKLEGEAKLINLGNILSL